METAEGIRERVEHERRLIDRLKAATTRFSDAQLERMWAIKSAHEHGLSIRQIAGTTGLSSSRVHQVLNTEDPARIPRWATELRDTAGKEDYLTAETKLLRQCAHWLKQLENGEDVFVNFRLESDPERDYVRFDRTRVVRILERIAADLDHFSAGSLQKAQSDAASEHKRRLAHAPPAQRRFSTREQRNALRAELKLPKG